MSTRRLEMRDLRSLERRSMYTIFHPLDVDERLPRELVLEGKRQRRFEIRYMEIAGIAYLPTLVLLLVLMGSLGVNGVLAFTLGGFLVVGFLVYALTARFR
jgi:hypothetical protein